MGTPVLAWWPSPSTTSGLRALMRLNIFPPTFANIYEIIMQKQTTVEIWMPDSPQLQSQMGKNTAALCVFYPYMHSTMLSMA
eukprot:scaffold161098_cov20-Tisochrysis_lutea.AAC.2